MHDPTKLAHYGHVHDMDREFTKLTRVDIDLSNMFILILKQISS